MSFATVGILAICVLLLGYLFYALLQAEKF
jgi:K+-transporting ATPase KdpF subunit